MHYECRNGNYRFAGNKCPRFSSGHHFQVAKAARLGHQCDTLSCGAELVRVVPPSKEHGGKKISFLTKGLSNKFRSPKGRNRKNVGKKHRIK
jgi:hypothetical protein